MFATIGTFIIEKILIPLGFDIAKDGAKDGLRHVFFRKSIKKEKQQHEEIHAGVLALQEEMKTLTGMIASDTSDVIKRAAADLQPLIENLHVKTAHEALDNLRQEVKTADRKTLARIDYYRGCCSRYINKEACQSEFNLAFQEMTDASTFYSDGFYDPAIIGGKIYVLCLSKNKDAALQMAAKLKDVERSNIWAWVPELLFSEDLTTAYNSLPEDIDKITVLSNATMFGGQHKSLGIDVHTWQPIFPDCLTYENIPLWMLSLSVLTNRYIPVWNMEALMEDSPAGSIIKDLNVATTTFLSLLDKTELGELSADVPLFNLITGYRITKDSSLLPKLRECNSSSQFRLFQQLSYAIFLSKEENFEEAKSYLKGSEILDDASIYNFRFHLAVASADISYGQETLHQLIERNVELPGQLTVFLLVLVHDQYEMLKEDARKVKINGEVEAKVFEEIIKSLDGETIDTEYLLAKKGEMAVPMRPFAAIALNKAGLTQEALDLSESCTHDGYIDLTSNIYFSLLKETHSNTRLNAFLRKVREGGYRKNISWLREEYALAAREEDYPRLLEIAKALYELAPKNPSYFTCLLSMQYQNGHFDKVKEMAEHLGEYDFPENDVSQIFNVLLLSDLTEMSVSFLYDYIRTHSFCEELSLLYHTACTNPRTAPIIQETYRVVEEGHYVTYKHNGELHSDIILQGQRTSCMIGKTVGEVVSLKDRLDRSETYEIIEAHNRYYKLLEEVYREIGENKYQSAVSFTIDDLDKENPLASLAKFAGHDEQWMAEHSKALEEYKKGERSISNFFNVNEIIADLYNHLFGDFKVYCVPTADFQQLYELNEAKLEDFEFCLDITAVVLLFELALKFGLNYPFKMIVPQGVVNLLEATIAKETHAMPAGIYLSVTEKLGVINGNTSETWFLSRLKNLLSWINQKTTIEVAHEMVEVDATNMMDQSHYMTLAFQSIFLTKHGKRALVSEDRALSLQMGSHTPVADVNYLVSSLCGKQYKQISEFLVESNIYGSDISEDYVFQQYELSQKNEVSSYKQCRENMIYCPALCSVVVSFCSRVYAKPIVTANDELTVTTTLTELFRSFERNVAQKILATAYQQLPHMRQVLLQAYKIAYPIYL